MDQEDALSCNLRRAETLGGAQKSVPLRAGGRGRGLCIARGEGREERGEGTGERGEGRGEKGEGRGERALCPRFHPSLVRACNSVRAEHLASTKF